MVSSPISTSELSNAESLISQFQSILLFLGEWLSHEIEKAKQGRPYHILVGYVASPYGRRVAEKIDHIFGSLLTLPPRERSRLRKKVIEATSQPDFESVLFELEISHLLLRHGHAIEVEPCRPKKGPELRTTFQGQQVYIEAKKLQADAEAENLWKTHTVWARTVKQSALDQREWNLYQRYLADNQFPNSGLHLLAIDTSKFLHSAEMLPLAWDNYCRSDTKANSQHPVHVLILCRRENQGHTSWLNSLTDGAVVLDDPLLPVPDDVLGFVRCVFRPEHGRS
jgi:hypothetical protein